MENKIGIENLQVDHSLSLPLHIQVEQILRKLIALPRYQKGELLPKEMDIAEKLGVSRNTVRQAANKLVFENLLVRTKGVGTRAVRKVVTTRLSNWHSFSQEMHQLGLEFINYEIKTSWQKADARVAKNLGIEENTKVFKLERVRGLEDGPFVYFISYIHPRIPITGKENFYEPLYDILEQEYNTFPELSKEEIQAILADSTIAEKLNVNVQTPILHRKRYVYDADNMPIEYNLCYYLGDKFTYSIDIKR